MYVSLLQIHSILRWVVLLAAAGALGLLVQGVAASTWGKPQRIGSLVYLISVDSMVTLGLLLYFVSPTVQLAFSDPAAAMKDPSLRRFFVEHPSLMLGAVALLHIGNVRAKSAPEPRRARAAITYALLALALILAGIPWGR